MTKQSRSYHDEKNLEYITKTRSLVKEFPLWFSDYLRAQENTLTPLTRLNYTFDCRVFFDYLILEHADFYGIKLHEITPALLGNLSITDLERYLEYLNYYIKVPKASKRFSPASGTHTGSPAQEPPKEVEYENGNEGKARKLSSLRSLYKYLYKNDLIASNPAELLTTPKKRERAIIRLSETEVRELVHTIESGDGLTQRQKHYHKHTVLRDIAIVILFLTTGMRVSELVGLNIRDINFKDDSLKIIRKGGSESILYFGAEAEDALQNYLEQRKHKETYDLEAPLFLSMQNKRISTRSVENLVKKYAKIVTPLKKISPHKLRSTYGTMLYENTGDIYLVADVLGHKDVNTTKKHYAAMSEQNRRYAAQAIKLKADDDPPQK